MAEDAVVWGIHAGRTGDAHSLFMRRHVIGIGWSAVGDLSAIPPSLDEFRKAYTRAYPEAKPGAVAPSAGQMYRFVFEVKPGDLVVYPARSERKVYIGRIEGTYTYDPSVGGTYPNLRRVNWLKGVAREAFSQGALYEIGASLALFRVRNHASEFVAALEDGPSRTPLLEDASVVVVARDIERTTHDFILKKLSQELKGHPFAEFVSHLLNTMGYRTRVSPEGTDGGVDIVAHRDELGFEPPLVKVQVKSTEGAVGAPTVQALYGNVQSNEHGLVVTLGSFTAAAEAFAKSKSNLRLINGEELVGLVLDHYEQFDSRYKGMLPLRRVYVPEPLEDSEA